MFPNLIKGGEEAKTISDDFSNKMIKLIEKLVDSNDIKSNLDLVTDTLKERVKDIGPATVTQILFCLKPNDFPIVNGNQGEDIYESLGVDIEPSVYIDITKYSSNVERIQQYRDDNYKDKWKNYRIIDRLAFNPNNLVEDNDMKENESDENINMNKTKTVLESKNLILFGPPGTGKTYNTVYYALSIIEKKSIVQIKNEYKTYGDAKKKYKEYKSKGQIKFVTFHQSYSYEEFIEGIKPYLKKNDNDCSDIQYKL